MTLKEIEKLAELEYPFPEDPDMTIRKGVQILKREAFVNGIMRFLDLKKPKDNNKFKVSLMPNFISVIGSENKIPINELTNEEAEHYSELLKNEFLIHYNVVKKIKKRKPK